MAVLHAAITLPTTPGFKRMTAKSFKVAAKVQNPFTLQSQTQEWQGESLGFACTLPPMLRAAGEEWVATLMACRGITGTFMLRLPLMLRTPRGSAGGAPKLDGAHAAGAAVISTKGWPVNQANTLKAGDWIQVGNYLRKVLFAEDTDANGKASFDIFPNLPVAFGDGEPLVTSDPKGIFRLSKNQFDYDISDAGIYAVAFEAEEAL